MGRVSIIIQNVPSDVFDCVHAESVERNRPISWIVGEALSAHYGMPFDDPARYPRPTKNHHSTTWVMRVPTELRQALAVDASSKLVTVRERALEILKKHCNPEEEA